MAEDHRLKILAHVPKIDGPLGGGEVTFQAVCKFLMGRGHDITLLVERGVGDGLPGAQVVVGNRPSKILPLYLSSDVLLTQRRPALQPVRELTVGRGYTSASGLPLRAFLSHNIGQPRSYGFAPEDLDLVMFNAKHTQAESQWPGRSIVLNPPVFPEEYETQPGDRITQVNLSAKKGGYFFWRLVEALPNRKFLAVLGKEKSQIIPKTLPANCEIIDNTNAMRDDVYSRTRVLLVPSTGASHQDVMAPRKSAESWGRVGVEAAASGIPTIAVDTPGLNESLGPAGRLLPLDVDSWVKEIERLLNDKRYYAARSRKAKKRSVALHPIRQLKELERLLLNLVENR